MPIRTSSLSKRIASNGQALHRAMMSRGSSGEQQPSEAEQALAEERKLLKEEREKRHAQALLPRPSAAERLVRTHRAQAKDKPVTRKAAPEGKEAKEVKKPKAARSRAEKHAEKAAAQEAGRRAPKKPAK